NGQGEFLAASHEYNELGQLIEKNLHRGQGSQSFLQSIDYSYNIRGWLTGINKRDNNNDTDDAFFQELFYDSVATVSEFNCNAQYNGNIAATLWKNSKNGTQKGYCYTYDALNRLTAAAYGERSGGAWNFGKYKVPEINYDYNGNITKLVRYGFCGQSYTCIDSLIYHYHNPGSNRLIGIIELADRYCGFRAVNTMPAYYYDANGNMNMDKNKGIEAIVYNHLNLPTKIEFENNKRIYYLYDAAGTKLRKYYYEDNRPMTTTDYSGPFVYTGHHPDYILTSEGRLKWDDHDSLFYPEYFIKDHLGNVRVVLTTNPNQHHLSQITDYYPFGMEIPVSGNSDNQLKYNGKEFQMEAKLEWYDYGARFYDPALGRFHTTDAFAEKYYSFSPYQYGANNPVLFIDINGDSLQVTNEAILAIYHALDKNANVKFDVKNGVIDPESFKEQAKNSDDIVLKDLYEIASDKRMVELNVSNKETYMDKNGNIQSNEFPAPYDFDIKDLGPDVYKQMKALGEPDGKTIQGNLGSTLIPGERSLSGKRPTNGNIQIIINGKGSLNHRAVATAHEFGHVVLYLRGLPHGHGQPGVDKAVYDERSNVVKKRLGYDY
ncbi:MAG: RHS repeat-associated core domain-containing protein, partial [Bacteroidales bacterium]|nr:RHS repeat-associated core domain-containing protein [Bacteroidales bacterium]